ncbi:MAG TPA: hypothetical protein PKL73_12920 [Polyangiaceae bacterium]|nr:MAG: hypothetical protein BWY17_04208 [Deltaproteobacteria bacterium ADurb.Bin207]HNS97845.1 hypothetical protein [Polyangiaceae bacterium]HNZ22804.1 hypothetical protein [Polyangiaceae bacterium]HOD24773.1 hypothetical protein [Polyangiaceae bacterium]HOE47702.1 hypothetical protein [Polyangiaceae bacterium]
MVGDDGRDEPPEIAKPVDIPRHGYRHRMSVSDEIGFAMLALAKTARSFSLYDPHNDAVKALISDYRDKSMAIARNAPVEIEVNPFELRYQKKTIYEEPDQERSIAFRLFRDGVRKLRFEPGLGWDDLVSLLEVLSVRCNGVRQQEEDLITMLRKARFQCITIDSVEGYIPDEETPENEALAPLIDESESSDPIADWDQPLPASASGSVSFQPIDPAALEALRAEESPQAIAAQAVRSVHELLQTANSLQDPDFSRQLLSFVEEVQHYLVVERNLDELARLAIVYRDALGKDQKLPILAEDRAFERVLRMVKEDEQDIPAALVALLGTPTAEMVPRALDMLLFGARGARRKALLQIVAHGSVRDASEIVRRLAHCPPDLARELFGILGHVAPSQRLEVAFDLLSHPDPDFQLELLQVIQNAPAGLRLARGLQTLMASEHESVRIRATFVLGHVGGAKAIPMLVEHTKRKAAELSLDEAEAIGNALGKASPQDAFPILIEWAEYKSGLRSILSKIRKDDTGNRSTAVIAAYGLIHCHHAASGEAIRGLLSRWTSDADVTHRLQRALDQLEKGRHHG